MKNEGPQFSRDSLAEQFSRAASSYDQAALMQQEVGRRLCQRLDYTKIDPKQILDLGSGTGYCTTLLTSLYPAADIFGLDIALNSLAQQSDKQHVVCADADLLPFADNSLDLVLSNMVIHWSDYIADIFLEVNRVLKPGGLFLFSTLGPLSLFELRDSWAAVDQHPRVHDFIDMHHLGDSLLTSGFSDPVMDSEPLTIDYERVETLLQDFKRLGVTNRSAKRQRGLLGKIKYQKFLAAYEQFKCEGEYPATYEVVYGQAWGKAKPIPGEVSIPISKIGKASSG